MILIGDILDKLREIPDASVQCVVTSPPYWGLRDYGVAEQIGQEKTPEEFVQKMVEVFREVRRVMRDDGTLWLNLGDSYNNASTGGNGATGGRDKSTLSSKMPPAGTTPVKKNTDPMLKPKDLCGIPWRVALALQADGWYLRSDIIWAKPNPMPESVTDRPTKSHEYIFLLTKSPRYFFDAEAVKEKVADATVQRLSQPTLGDQAGSSRVPGKTNGNMKAVGGTMGRNIRSVWSITTKPFKDAHFATFPEDIPERCIKAGSRVGDVVLDPFFGAGTTGVVAKRLRRNWIGIELNPAYAEIARKRIEMKPEPMI